MPSISDLEYLAGVTAEETAQSTAPTNVHVISGEVASEASSDGKVLVEIDGIVFGEADSQYIEIEAIGGLEEGDTVTILLTGETGHGMSLMGLGSVGSVDRIVGRVSSIEADYVKVEVLEANYAHITEGVIDNATIGVANINDLSANYAQIDGANITTATIRDAWINKLMVQSGLIAHEGTVYSLDAIQVNAANITAGTIDVERLVVTVDGEKYLVHIDTSTLTPTYEKLDGNVIEDLTITADKIVAGAITAEKITTENIVGSGGWINLRNGTFSYVNAITGNGIVWDGQHLTISGNVTIGSGSMSLAAIADAAVEANNIQIGGRNLLRDSDFALGFTGDFWINDGLYAWTEDNELTINGSAGAYDNESIYQPIENFCHEGGVEYTFSCDAVASTECVVSFGRFYGNVDDYGVSLTIPTTKTRISGTYTAVAGFEGEFRIGRVSNAALVVLSNLKLEQGNRPTGYTAAQEDIEARIDSTADDLSNLATDTSADISGLSDRMDESDIAQSELNDKVATLESMTDNLANTTQWLHFDSSEGLTIGENEGSKHTRYTATDIKFMDGDNELMRLSGDEGVKSDLITTTEIHLGNWVIMQRSNGNFTIKYAGEN